MTYSRNSLAEVQFVDATNVGATTAGLTGNYRDESAIDTALMADPTLGAYFTANVSSMPLNDKVYALRLLKDPLSFGTVGTTSGMS